MKPRWGVIAAAAAAALAVALIWPADPPRAADSEEAPEAPLTSLDGLNVRVGEADDSVIEAGFEAVVEPLPASKVKRIIKRLAPLATDEDPPPSALRPGTRPPPRTGVTVQGAFPAAGGAPPPQAVEVKPLEVRRWSPEGDVTDVPQVQVTFSQPMVAITGLDDIAAGDVPAQLSPDAAGRWRWISATTLVFEPAAPLTRATHYEVVVPAGTTSALGGVLERDHRFSFKTQPPRVVGIWPSSGERSPRSPLIHLRFDQPIDPLQVAPLVEVNVGGHRWPVHLSEAGEQGVVGPPYDWATNTAPDTWLALAVEQELPLGARVTVTVAAGVMPLAGTVASRDAQEFEFLVHEALRITEHRCLDYQCRPGSGFWVRFNNPLDTEAVDPATIQISPAPPELEIEVSHNAIYLRGKTRIGTYYVTVPPTVRDIYGQTLGRSQQFKFKVVEQEQVRAELSAPGGDMVILDPDSPPTIPVLTLNQPALQVEMYDVQPADYRAWIEFRSALYRWYEHDRRAGERPTPPGKRISSRRIPTGGGKDEALETRLDLNPALDDGRGHVVVLIEGQAPGDRPRWDAKWVQATGLNLTGFNTDEQTLMWLTSLHDGTTQPGMKVELLDWELPTSSTAVTTDGDGQAAFDAAQVPQQMVVVGHAESDSVLMHWTRYEPSARQPELRWYVIDDRQLYRPGETVTFKGWVRQVDQGADGVVRFTVPEGLDVHYNALDPRGNELAKGVVPLEGLGGFSLEVQLPPEVELGRATIGFAAGDTVINGRNYRHDFRIEEFRRPEFEVSAKASDGPHRVGGQVTFSTNARYFSGGSMPGSDVGWAIWAQEGGYTPPGRGDFSYGPRDPWWGDHHWEWDYYWEPTRTHFAGKTDRDGNHAVTVDLAGIPAGRPMVLTGQATVHDINRQARAASAQVLVHPGDLYVGVRLEFGFVQPGQPLAVETLVTDHDGNVVSGANVLVTMEPLWVDDPIGPPEPVEPYLFTSTAKVSSSVFTPELGGVWKVRALVTDSEGRPSVSELILWVAGGGLPPGAMAAMDAVRLMPDQDSYLPGDTAHILVTSPVYPAEGFWTVRLEDGVLSGRLSFDGPTASFDVTVGREDMPNVPVRVVVVGSATDDARAEQDPGARRPAWGQGSVSLQVRPVDRILTVVAEPQDAVLDPGSTTAVDVTVTDHQGKPVAGAEVALIVVDEAVLSLAGYTLADPVTAFHTWRSGMDVSITDLHGYLLPRPEEVYAELQRMKEMADPRSMKSMEGAECDESAAPVVAAPGASTAPGSKIAVRSDFRALALFTPAVASGADGRAHVTFTMPDNLTRYRVMAVVAEGTDRFGSGESSITARRQLMVRPSPPRFLSYGDHFQLPVVVQNQSDRTLEIQVAARASNAEFTDGSGRKVVVPAGERAEVRLPARPLEMGTARFQIAAVAGTLSDAAEVAIPVWMPVTTEAFATYGSTDGEMIVQPVAPPGDVVPSWGGLEVTTSSTAIHALTDAYLYLASYPYDCSEQIASRILAVAALRDVLDAFDAAGLPPAEQIEAAIAADMVKLQSRQSYDGGFKLWPGSSRVDPYASVHATHALERAKTAGFDVPQVMHEQAMSYVRGIDQRIPAEYTGRSLLAVRAYALYVRALSGEDVTGAVGRMLDQTPLTGMALETAGHLTSALALSGGTGETLDRMTRHLNNRAVESAGTAEFKDDLGDQYWRIFWGQRRSDAIVLEALLHADPQGDLITKVVRGLQGHRTRGRWRTTQENAFVLLALRKYFDTYEAVEPDFAARLWLGGDYAGEHAFKGRTTERFQVDVPMEHLVKGGAQDLVLDHDGEGRLYYRIGIRYAPAELWLDAADYGFAVSRTYEAVDDPGDVTREEDGSWTIVAGSRVRVVLQLETGERRYHVALVDKLPAGLEPLTAGLVGSTAPSAQQDPWGPYWIEHSNLRDERGEAFTSLLYAGVYRWSYVVRATTPGSFTAPPPRAEEMYFPETFGRGPSERVVVE